MADYKELLRRAVQALPENNGAARRAVYEKARSALVGQLRAINPPLAARDITTHRLQLEDCIRQVEQEASEAVIAGMQEPPPPQPKVQTTQPPKLETRPQGKPQPAPVEPPALGPEPGSIEAIIAAAEEAVAAPPPAPAKPVPAARIVANAKGSPAKASAAKSARAVEPEPKAEEKPEDKAPAKPSGKAGRPLPSIVARAEAAKGKSSGGGPTVFGIPADKPYDNGRRSPTIEPRRDSGPRLEPGMRGQAAARQQMAEPIAFVEQPVVAAAMSSVREVEVESAAMAHDPQGAIDRAIATLDREARGEMDEPMTNGTVVEMPMPKPEPAAPERKGGLGTMFRDRQQAKSDRSERTVPPERQERHERNDRKPAGRRDRRGSREGTYAAETPFQRAQAEPERGGISAVTIFLSVFAVLLIAVGGAGIWAWREGYLNLDTMFARGEPTQQEAVVPQAGLAPLDATPEPAAVTGPGNTVTAEPAPPVEEAPAEERLAPTETETAAVEPLALVAPAGEAPLAEERLPVEGTSAEPVTAETAVASVDPATIAGSQSLLLEASEDGTTGAVPFSGTVEWSRGADETGNPTLIGKANIPARNLSVEMLIRKNSDPSLPASHLMEINFSVTESFIGGSVAGLPGVLLKNEELVQGAPLVGASARVVGNSFLFALSASPEDSAVNSELLTTRKWMDLAIIYATGKRAIITLEKDDAAATLFREVFAEWGKVASAQ